MKKPLLFSAIAVLLAVGGATASTAFADEYFDAGSFCEGIPTSVRPCEVGTEIECTEGGLQYYYRPNGTTQCLQVLKPDSPPM